MKCDLFCNYRDAKEISLLFLQYKPLCRICKNTCEFHLYCWDHVCKVNEWCLGDCFHVEFRASSQALLHNYCIRKCKKLCLSVPGFLWPFEPFFFAFLKYLH